MDTIEKATVFLNIKLNDMSVNDRIEASKDAKAHILNIFEIYKKSKEPVLMNLMKSVIIMKRKIDKPLK